jgi:hypothetical protein
MINEVAIHYFVHLPSMLACVLKQFKTYKILGLTGLKKCQSLLKQCHHFGPHGYCPNACLDFTSLSI